jgi:hypothetical protein
VGATSAVHDRVTVMSNSQSVPDNIDWEREEEFAYTDALTLPQWGWEFLRRNPDYREVWENAGGHERFALRQASTIVERQRPSRFGEWGLMHGCDPQLDCRSSVVFWHPDLCGRVLRLNALPVEEGRGCKFHLSDLVCRSVLLRTSDGAQHVLFRDGCYALQLFVEGESLVKPAHLMPVRPLDRDSDQFRSYQCFVDFLVSSRLLPSHFPPTYLGERLKRVLRALDGDFAGASQRRIAVMLFGQEHVDNEWCAVGRPLRDKVRRTIHRGHDLMRGGYRSLIR